MKPAFCAFCEAPVKVEDDFDEAKEKAVCNWSCYYAEKYFCKYMSDNEVDMRSYFDGQDTDE